jgi:hypothetical protein
MPTGANGVACRDDRTVLRLPAAGKSSLRTFTGLVWVAECVALCDGEAGLGGVMAKVYVSSTIIDLKQERQAVLD